ncbi:protein HEAT INTOLERANT 4-like [Pyrus x bretschneideri]|uniref:protein HEAT INTOLERANT 4-like n=1 Tax=Pyrus x bretschneideri TaxID=225117 RepID=UPI00051153BD|nr:protein HEAT INTOLERANT 4-like [Pyrus x bretschneideri]
MANLYKVEDEQFSNSATNIDLPLQKRKWVQPAGAEDLQKAASPFGIEDWDQLEQVHSNFKWDFPNLRQAFEQGLKLRIDTIDNNNNVCLFRSTENEYEHVVIPTLVAVVPPFSPSLRDSNPNEHPENDFKETVALKKMKMGWIPYVKSKHDIPRTRIFVLGCSCTQRRAALNRIEEGPFEQFPDCMLYVFNTLEFNPVDQ